MINQYKFGFVILHYNNIDDTENCVESIYNRIDSENYNIVIVDNNSNNGSGELLSHMYENKNNLKVIINKNNFGFSYGNNLGIKYAIDTLKCDFIVMINSDTLIIQDNFCEEIIKEYKNSKCALIGPEINNYNNKFQYPETDIPSIKVLKRTILIKRILYFFSIVNMDLIIIKILKKIGLFKKKEFSDKDSRFNTRMENVILHGSCIIFTPTYFKYFNSIPEKTKFYCEELFIYNQIKSKDLLSVYNPSIKIFHKVNGATKNISKRQFRVRQFKYQNHISATKVLIKELKEYERGKNE